MCCKNNYLLSIFFYKIIIGFLNLPFIGCAESLLLLVWKCYLLSCWTCWQHFQQTLVLISFNLLKLTQTSVGFHFSRVLFSTEVFWKRFVNFVLLEKRPIDATRELLLHMAILMWTFYFLVFAEFLILKQMFGT